MSLSVRSSGPLRVHLRQPRSWSAARSLLALSTFAQVLSVLGCSDSPPLDSAEPELTPPLVSTGGSEAVAGTGGTGGGAPIEGTPSGGAPVNPPEPPLLMTEVRIEEGEFGFCFVDGILETTHAGFAGAGYANADNQIGAGIEWKLQVGEAGTYALEFLFANGAAAERPATLSINGEQLSAEIPFPSSMAWTTWSTVALDVTLTEGENTLALNAATLEGLANVDSLLIRGAALAPLDCASPEGTGGTAGTGGSSGTGGVDAGTGGGAVLSDITVYVAGDSTVSTYADSASPSDQAGWGQMLHEGFDDRVTVQNRASGGRTARWFHMEGSAQWILDRIQPGDYLFVQFGTNDSHKTATFSVNGTTYPRYADPNTDFKAHLLDYYVVPARAKNAIPVLVTPPPRNSAYCGNGNSLGGYAQAMRELAVAEDVILLDLNQRTFDHLSAICPAPTPENFFFLRADSSVDGTHFQENGARHMAAFLGDEMLEKSVGPYQYLLP